MICACEGKNEFLINKTKQLQPAVCACVSMAEVYSIIESFTECIKQNSSELTNRATYLFIIYFTLQITQSYMILLHLFNFRSKSCFKYIFY